MVELAGWSIAVAVLGLAFYVAHRMNPSSFRLRTSVARVFSFSLEIDSRGAPQEPACGEGHHSGLEGAPGIDAAVSPPDE